MSVVTETNGHTTSDPSGLGISGDALHHFEAIVANVSSMRSELLRWAAGGDPRRDIADECGYPAPGREGPKLYQDLYDYEPVSNRVVRLWPDETWKITPLVYESEDAEVVTAFEEAWDNLGSSIRVEESWHQEEEGSIVWDYLRRLDCISGIGHWGCLLFGIDDGLDLSMPAYGVEEIHSIPSDDPALADSRQGVDAMGRPIYRSRFPGLYQLSSNQAKTRGRQLRYLRVFPESLAQVTRWEANETSPRFGLPVSYLLSFTDLNDRSPGASGSGLTMATREVHWTRVLHVPAQLESSESVGVPRLRPVLRRCLDLMKLYGSSAEMFYKGAFMGLSLETNPQMGGKVQMNKADLRSMIENYQNGLQRYLALTGLSAKTLAPTVADPTPQINAQIQGICIQIDVPQRIFMGSERGELSSGQDAKAWDARVHGRRTGHTTPRLIVPFTDRCILLGVLPRPANGYVVYWPEPESLTPVEKADLAAKNTSADVQYVSGGVETLIPPFDYLTRVRGFSEEEAEAILEGAEEHAQELSEAGLGPDGQPLDPDQEDLDIPTDPLLERISGISGAVELFKLRKDGAISDETLQELLILFYQLSPAEAKRLVADGLPEPPAPPPGSLPPGAALPKQLSGKGLPVTRPQPRPEPQLTEIPTANVRTPSSLGVWTPFAVSSAALVLHHLSGKHDQKTHGRSQKFVDPSLPGQGKVFNPYAHSNKGKGPIDEVPQPKPQPKPVIIRPKPPNGDPQIDPSQPAKALGGSTGAKLVKATDGKQYVLKTGPGKAQLANEVQADDLYRAAGVAVPKSKLDSQGRKWGEFIEGGQTLKQWEKNKTPEQINAAYKQIGRNFAVDALLGNWDVVGMGRDNILHKDGSFIRIDNGGALLYRAQGSPKGSAFGSKVGELETLRDPSKNADSAKVFAHLTDADVVKQIGALSSKRDTILAAVKDPDLKTTLASRLDYMENWAKEKTPKPETVTKRDSKQITEDDYKATRLRNDDTAELVGTKLDAAQTLVQKGPPPVSKAQAIEAIDNYTSSMYRKINKALREGADINTTPPPSMKHLQVLAQQKLKEPIVVHRGIKGDAAKQFATLSPGDELVHKGFVSTTLLPSIAIGSFSGYGSGLVMEIKAKTGVYVDKYSIAAGEYELIQAHGTRYRVVKVEKNVSVKMTYGGKTIATLIRLEEI